MTGMRKIFAVFAALAFIAVQAADLALPETAHADEAGAPAPSVALADDPDCCEDGDCCALHCPCHSLHHAFAQSLHVQTRHGARMIARTRARQDFGAGMAHRPPVPPPLA